MMHFNFKNIFIKKMSTKCSLMTVCTLFAVLSLKLLHSSEELLCPLFFRWKSAFPSWLRCISVVSGKTTAIPSKSILWELGFGKPFPQCRQANYEGNSKNCSKLQICLAFPIFLFCSKSIIWITDENLILSKLNSIL